MAGSRWIIMSSFLMLLFSSREAAASSFTVRGGDEATLPCESVIQDQNKCDSITWKFYRTGVTLFDRGLIQKDKSDRLSVTEQCSLVIKTVTKGDAGYYICRQFSSGKQTHSSQAFLSVVTMTKHRTSDELELRCSVSSVGWCGHSVKWLYQEKDIDKDIKTSTSECSGTVTFPASYLEQNSKYYDLFSCSVTNNDMQKVEQFPFSPPQSAGWSWWQRLICVFVGVAALLIISVAVLRWRRTKGSKTQTDENMADPEDGVSYASITYIKKSNRKAQDHAAAAAAADDDDDEDDTVTYSTVKAPLPSSADPSNLYASVNKPNK